MSASNTSLSPDEVRALIQRDEGQFLEFKSLWDRSGSEPRVLDRRKVRDLIAEVVAAFANADGGTLLLGVDDDGTASGHGYAKEALEMFLAVPVQRLRPAVACHTERVTVEGKELLVIEVPMSVEAVMVDGNGFPTAQGIK